MKREGISLITLKTLTYIKPVPERDGQTIWNISRWTPNTVHSERSIGRCTAQRVHRDPMHPYSSLEPLPLPQYLHVPFLHWISSLHPFVRGQLVTTSNQWPINRTRRETDLATPSWWICVTVVHNTTNSCNNTLNFASPTFPLIPDTRIGFVFLVVHEEPDDDVV